MTIYLTKDTFDIKVNKYNYINNILIKRLRSNYLFHLSVYVP